MRPRGARPAQRREHALTDAEFPVQPARPAGEPARAGIGVPALILLRWLAVGGQVGAVETAQRLFGILLPLEPIYVLIGTSVLTNLGALFLRPARTPLAEGEAAAILTFDTVIIGVLLMLTGGVQNPFALMLLVPAVVGATAISSWRALAPGVAALVSLAALPALSLPLVLPDGRPLELPGFWVAGHWVAIAVCLGTLLAHIRRTAADSRAMADALLEAQLALARERRLTDLDGMAAAAAHELGTPLGTIKIAAAELAGELGGEAAEDARLIAQEADRCMAMLRQLGQSREDGADPVLGAAPIETILREAAAPHMGRGKRIAFAVEEPADGPRPRLRRAPEIVHALRNVIQNAVDHARRDVTVTARSGPRDETVVTVRDDGPGFPARLFDHLGEPGPRRAGRMRGRGGGMGMGLFIARTLLERTGARIDFRNARDEGRRGGARGGGAIVDIVWPAGAAGLRPPGEADPGGRPPGD